MLDGASCVDVANIRVLMSRTTGEARIQVRVHEAEKLSEWIDVPVVWTNELIRISETG